MTPITSPATLGKEVIIVLSLKFAKPLSVLSVFGRVVGGTWIKQEGISVIVLKDVVE